MAHPPRFRLVTRSNFDGLACAALLKEQDLIHEILFVHPKDVQDGKIAITPQDILTNLPPHAEAHLVFNTRLHPAQDQTSVVDNVVYDPQASSTARVIHNHYGGRQGFPRISDVMISAVDQSNVARYSQQEIVHPTGWTLFNFLMDPRTGIGRFRQFRLSNHRLIFLLIDLCRVQEIDQIMTLPDLQERVEVYFAHQKRFLEQMIHCASVQENLLVLDMRREKAVWAGNRFMKYAHYPQCNLSIEVFWGPKRAYTLFSIGTSILNKTSSLNVGQLAHTFGGGGHHNAGSCRAENDRADATLAALIAAVNRDKEQSG